MTLAPRAATPALLQVDAILSRLQGRPALQEVCRFLRESFRHYRWVGVYRVDGTDLVLDAWDGPEATEHTRIPIARGICGQAARENRTVVVEDVRAASEYLACFRETRAEIVVPIRVAGTVVGEIDIDGNEVRAFDRSDGAFLEAVATKLGAAVQRAAGETPPG
ncbi:MAG TPA: GAF domain-containing protein [Thermoplasmata archaeon]|nr:GAF domain-containing protein [Thermoplasmata archaeon]